MTESENTFKRGKLNFNTMIGAATMNSCRFVKFV